MHGASQDGHIKILVPLIKAKADLNLQDFDGIMALHLYTNSFQWVRYPAIDDTIIVLPQITINNYVHYYRANCEKSSLSI